MNIDNTTDRGTFHAVWRGSLVLGLFALLTVGLVASTWLITKERIAEQIRLSEQNALFEVLPAHHFDNNLLDTPVILPEPTLLGALPEGTQGWVAFKNEAPSAVILPTGAPDGYNGRIQLLVGITGEGVLTGVRVITHKETPGLGDKIETRVSDWINSFNDQSLQNTPESAWTVKKDGGSFDQFTGATITPRAIVSAVYRTLLYFSEYQQQIFASAAASQQQNAQQQQAAKAMGGSSL